MLSFAACTFDLCLHVRREMIAFSFISRDEVRGYCSHRVTLIVGLCRASVRLTKHAYFIDMLWITHVCCVYPCSEENILIYQARFEPEGKMSEHRRRSCSTAFSASAKQKYQQHWSFLTLLTSWFQILREWPTLSRPWSNCPIGELSRVTRCGK